MTLATRVVLEFLIFTLLAAFVGRLILLRLDLDADVLWVLLPLVAVSLGIVRLYQKWQWRNRLAANTSLLQGALWDLVRLMENYPVRSSSRRGAGRQRVLERFAIEGAGAVGAGREMPMGGTGALDLTTLGFELIDRNEKDGSEHWRRVNGIRRGCFAFIALVQLRDPALARRAMIEHMKRQRDRSDGLDNFTDFKRLLNLPTVIPFGDLPELNEKISLTLELEQDLRDVVRLGLPPAYGGLFYKPWGEPGEAEVVYVGDEILTQMREYIR